MEEYKIKRIEEGLTKIEFPEFEKVSSEAPVFYNPHMELNRDLSILAIQVFQKEQDREINICDLFGGSGIRGVRYKNEIDGVGEVSINDISETANHYERHNIELNDLKDVHVHQHDASMFLSAPLHRSLTQRVIVPGGIPFYASLQPIHPHYAEPTRSLAFESTIQSLTRANTAMKTESGYWRVLSPSPFQSMRSTLR